MRAVSGAQPKSQGIVLSCSGEAGEIARLIRDTRQRRGLTQFDLADRLGSTQSTVARWESGRHDFQVGTVARIAQALGFALVLRFDAAKAER